MEKLTRFLPITIFCLFLIKLGVLGSSFEEALIALGLMGLVGFIEFKPKHNELEQLKQDLKQQAENIEILKNQLNDTKSAIVGMKMNIGIRSTGGNNQGQRG